MAAGVATSGHCVVPLLAEDMGGPVGACAHNLVGWSCGGWPRALPRHFCICIHLGPSGPAFLQCRTFSLHPFGLACRLAPAAWSFWWAHWPTAGILVPRPCGPACAEPPMAADWPSIRLAAALAIAPRTYPLRFGPVASGAEMLCGTSVPSVSGPGVDPVPVALWLAFQPRLVVVSGVVSSWFSPVQPLRLDGPSSPTICRFQFLPKGKNIRLQWR